MASCLSRHSLKEISHVSGDRQFALPIFSEPFIVFRNTTRNLGFLRCP
jgi:hypothetical protein